MKFLSKRLLTTLALMVLCSSATPTKADDNNANTLLIGSAIAAGIIGICGLIYGIMQSYKKSPEQIAKDAQEALDTAHMYGQCFHAEYMGTFQQACYEEPTLNEIERNFLEAVIRHAQDPNVHIDVEQHIDAVHSSLISLEKTLKEVEELVDDLLLDDDTYLPIYDHLVTIMLKSEAELAYLKDYYQRFTEHRAYFRLAACEAKLLEKYKDAIVGTNLDSIVWEPFVVSIYDPEKVVTKETQLLHIAKMHNTHSNYPLVQYYLQLCNDIATLDYCIRSLTHQYSKIHAAKKLWHQFSIIRDIIADDHVFKEEYKRKNEDDAQRVLLELTRRKVEAQEQMARAATQQAMAAQQKAFAAQQQLYTKQSTTTGQNGSNNADDAQITIGSGNNTRTVSVAWYEQNKPGAVDSYIE